MGYNKATNWSLEDNDERKITLKSYKDLEQLKLFKLLYG